ncbi:MAG: ABC transporter permease [Patescibacteria group bacterium]
MRKFLVLLKKEIKELLTAQIIAPLIITAVLFFFIGNLMDKEQDKINQNVNVTVINNDSSSKSSEFFIQSLKDSGIKINLVNGIEESKALEQVKQDDSVALMVIPANFEQSLDTNQPEKIKTYTIVRNFSMMGSKNYGIMMAAIATANEKISNINIASKSPDSNPDAIKNPIKADEFVVVGDKQANISPNLVMGFVSQQTMFIPIILFMVIIFASQMIATAIANEKENKTLETLLTTPVKRNYIVVAKMAGAGMIALLSSLIYMVGFRSYINGISGGAKATSEISNIISNLGLTLKPESYILLGLSLFIGILVALAISLILGAFAEDVKGVAGLTTPLMIVVLIPYFLTMFLDINSLSPTLRYVVYAIPFSHIFMAAPNLFMHQYLPVVYGILYQLLWFIVFVLIAAKIFSTDKIITMKLNFGKKKI